MKKPLLLAHRGFSGLYPENSPLAFRMAAEKTEADGFESDVRYSRDGALVVFHDPSLERTSNGAGTVADRTWDELRGLDIGAWKSPEFAGQHPWLLGELLDFCRETKKRLNLELKNYDGPCPDLEERVIGEITKRKMQDEVFVSSFNHVSMQRFKELCPEIETGLLYDKPLLFMGRYIARSNADAMHPRFNLLRWQPELMGIFHARGMKVNAWTADRPEDIRWLLENGADGIISNRPDILCRVAAEAR